MAVPTVLAKSGSEMVPLAPSVSVASSRLRQLIASVCQCGRKLVCASLPIWVSVLLSSLADELRRRIALCNRRNHSYCSFKGFCGLFGRLTAPKLSAWKTIQTLKVSGPNLWLVTKKMTASNLIVFVGVSLRNNRAIMAAIVTRMTASASCKWIQKVFTLFRHIGLWHSRQ